MTTKQILAAIAAVALVLIGSTCGAQNSEELDARVQGFLDSHSREWRDLNVPATDGRVLHELIVERGYTQAVEIGTSTGHSTIWIAWALAKTGGRLTTIELDRRRYEEARQNVAAAGLADYVDFILGDAHEVVPALTGPYDFVFSDADKNWYINYFDALYPKLTADACFTAHNVGERDARGEGRSSRGWAAEYYQHVSQIGDMETHIHPDSSRSGIAVSCKRQ